jgi:proteic killer suppression protein
MIKTIRHKRLKALYEKNQTKGIQQSQIKRINALLARLEASSTATDMDLPGLRLHPLKGEMAGFYAVDVSGNWRLIFRFDNDGNAIDVDLVDYH